MYCSYNERPFASTKIWQINLALQSVVYPQFPFLLAYWLAHSRLRDTVGELKQKEGKADILQSKNPAMELSFPIFYTMLSASSTVV